MSNIIKITLGSRFGSNLSIFGLCIAALGTYLFFTNSLMGIWLGAIGLIIALGPAGVEIDLSRKRIRNYDEFGFFKLGKWSNLIEFKKLILRTEFQQKQAQVLGAAHVSRQKLYFVELMDGKNNKMSIKCFGGYKKARKFALEYEEILDIPFTDQVKQLQQSSLKRRAQRRRK